MPELHLATLGDSTGPAAGGRPAGPMGTTRPPRSLTMPRGDAAGRLTSPGYGLGSASWDYLANGLLAKQTTDQETGLIALAYRYYAPGVGRFLNRDPVGYRGGMNVYAYAGGAAMERVDPAGLAYVHCRWNHCQVVFEGTGCDDDQPGTPEDAAGLFPSSPWGIIVGRGSVMPNPTNGGIAWRITASEDLLCECIKQMRGRPYLVGLYNCISFAMEAKACAELSEAFKRASQGIYDIIGINGAQ
ncbi:MAG: RHS repeat-associated core domain-containing protein [Gemmatimonadaceae bacterium]|nr:RHS repeat-associated core domain-containing protein [Gemmatimonadaceae bacterium]